MIITFVHSSSSNYHVVAAATFLFSGLFFLKLCITVAGGSFALLTGIKNDSPRIKTDKI
jgi:hypothetical protein